MKAIKDQNEGRPLKTRMKGGQKWKWHIATPCAEAAAAEADAVSAGKAFRLPLLPTVVQPPPAVVPEAVAKDAIIAWFRGEFAAANAIIDALCSHLAQLEGVGGSEYEFLFAAVHRRRFNWIPILQMQKYFSIADVTLELQKVAARKAKEREAAVDAKQSVPEANESSAEKVTVSEASAASMGERC